jgi:3-hydroxybutyrate dehydrogenase
MTTQARFAGRVVAVTGAARGLGAALAAAFAAEGAAVVGVDLAGDGLLHADIATAEGNEHMVRTALERHGRLDVLVLNAGLQHKAPVAAFPEGEWDRLQDVLLKGPFLALRAAWSELARTGGNAVVISSTSGIAAEPEKTAYCAAKAGVLGLVRAAALEGGQAGVRVNAIAPGWMRTPMALAQLEAIRARDGLSEEEATVALMTQQPVKRFVELSEVAAAATFLASDAASAITGVCLPVDLGLLAG